MTDFARSTDQPGFSPLDPEALAGLRALDPEGRSGVVHRVLVTFRNSLQRMQLQLQADPAGPDAALLQSLAHQLKSSGAAVGALPLARVCAEVESSLREGRCSDLPAQARRVVLEMERAELAVEAMLRAP